MKYVPKRLERTADISRGIESRGEVFRQALLALGVLALVYLGLGMLAELVAARIPTSWEARLANAVASSVGEEAEDTRLVQVFNRLLAQGDLRPLPYHLTVFDIDLPNAFAFPGGAIGVTSGLLDSVQSEQGLAMVIGHELGHHHKRHVLKRLGRALLIVAPIVAVSGQGAEVITRLLELGESGYSRSQEREADEIGLRMVHKVFGNTKGALEFFENIVKEEGDDRWAGLAASHPATGERIDDLRALAAELAGLESGRDDSGQ